MELNFIGSPDAIIRQWFNDDGEVTAGAANVRFWRYNPTLEYLQPGFTTWGLTPNDFAASYSAGDEGWILKYTPTSAMVGPTIFAQMRHSDPELDPLPETILISPALGGSGAALYAPSHVTLNRDPVLSLDFILRSPSATSAFDDPDGNIVDVTVVDALGAPIPGIILQGAPTGRMARMSQGVYNLQFVVPAPIPLTEARWTASYTKNTVQDRAVAITMFDIGRAVGGASVSTG